MSDREQPYPDEDQAQIEMLLREMTADDRDRIAPPTAIWERIETVALGSDHRNAEEHARTTRPARVATPAVAPSNVHSLEDRRRRWVPMVAGVAAAILLVVGGFVVVSRSGDEAPTVVATAELSHEANFDELGSSATAAAELVEADDGSVGIHLVDASLPAPDGEAADLELWLIRPDANGEVADIVSLGLVDPSDPGTFEIPSTYDPAQFSVVDISVEPRDGQPTHSGRSILRGALVQA